MLQVIGAPQQLPFCSRSGRDAVTVRHDCTIGRIDVYQCMCTYRVLSTGFGVVIIGSRGHDEFYTYLDEYEQ